MKKEGQKQFKKDFNSPQGELTNKDLREKYGFESDKEMIQYARDNNLVVIKEPTEEEKKNLEALSKGLNQTVEMLA